MLQSIRKTVSDWETLFKKMSGGENLIAKQNFTLKTLFSLKTQLLPRSLGQQPLALIKDYSMLDSSLRLTFAVFLNLRIVKYTAKEIMIALRGSNLCKL